MGQNSTSQQFDYTFIGTASAIVVAIAVAIAISMLHICRLISFGPIYKHVRIKPTASCDSK